MTKDKIQNKIQLEIINVNKTIANKRRIFSWLACTSRKKKGKERKKRKEISSQITSNHYTHAM
jgi:hypothetical protein